MTDVKSISVIKHEIIDCNTTESVIKTGNVVIKVTSSFDGLYQYKDLLYKLVLNKVKNQN